MKVYMIDLNSGRLLSPVIVGDDMTAAEAAALSPAYIATPPPEGMNEPRWDGEEWVEDRPSRAEEGVQEAEMPTAPTMEERLAAVEAAMGTMATILIERGAITRSEYNAIAKEVRT